MNTIPKSLHTVTVLVAVARAAYDEGLNAQEAIADALAVLGYANTPDTYQLADKARKVLAREVAK